jgi:hypothetical protein
MKKIAVMLPIAYRGGSLRAAKSMAKAIILAARQKNEAVQVVFSYVQDGSYDLHSDFNDLIEYGIVLRATVWQVLTRETLLATMPLLARTPKTLSHHSYCLPMDGANDFYDCDLWIIISDRLPAPLFPLRKYICVIYDYLQRYVPEIFGGIGGAGSIWELQEESYFPLVRNAECVLVTTPSTRADMVAYAGVSGAHITLIDMDFNPPEDVKTTLNDLNLPSNYFIWTTNTAAHKNHINAINALEKYYQDLSGKLELVVTGVNSEYLDVEREFDKNDPMLGVPQIKFTRDKISASQTLRERIHILGDVSEKVYASVLRKSLFLWHPNRYDNGTFSVIEAAYFQNPSLSARYPAMEYINQKFNLNLSFFDPHNTRDMAETLFAMERNYKKVTLPERKILLQKSWLESAPALYDIISEFL